MTAASVLLVSVNSEVKKELLTPDTDTTTGTKRSREGSPSVTVKVIEVEVPPPGSGLKTVMATSPGVDSRSGEMRAVSSLVVSKVVGRSSPSHCTSEAPSTNPSPLTVMVRVESRDEEELGETLERAGTGLMTRWTVQSGCLSSAQSAPATTRAVVGTTRKGSQLERMTVTT